MVAPLAFPVPTLDQLRELPRLESFVGFDGIPLIVNTRSWAAGTPTESVLDGSAVPCAFVATQDGRHVDPRGWHEGPSSGDDVFYERYEVREGQLARVAHGWIDRDSRRLTQSG